MASGSQSTQRNHGDGKVIGMMLDGELMVERVLSYNENRETITQLEKARASGFDCIALTSEGTYVTKKIYP